MRWPYENIGVTTTRAFRNLLNKIHGDIADDMQEHKDRADNIQAQVDNLVADGDSSPEAAQARVGADGTNYTTLKQRLDTEHADVTAQLADTADKINVSTVDNLLNFSDAESDMEIEVPSYYQAKINEIVNSIDKSELNIGFITDNHNQYSGYAPNSLKHYEYIALLSRLTHLDAVISGGDNANGWYSKPQILSELKSATSALFNRVKPDTDVYFLHGNHDNGAFQNGKKNLEDIITNEELKVLYQTKRNVYGEVRNGDSIYCYKDYIDKKIRVIMLNSFDFPNSTDSGGTLIYDNLNYGCYRNEQLNWLSHVALQVPSDYHVLIFTHAPLPGAFDNSTQYNSDVLLNILKAFKNGQNYTINDDTRDFPVSIDVDFSNSGTLIAIINGHLHRDDSTVYEGILCISVDASLCYSGAAGRVVNTATEDCWDVFSINPKSRTIKTKRFGFGSDRNWQY
ncbi:metallophosphoesterase [Heyndrickxia faecalis]|uniref:metallophosphoesterase n=1 Tax=Heyndrickxia faecalis TaxID=2824910 RepID=UPI003100E6A6